jgi:hypothetical protein
MISDECRTRVQNELQKINEEDIFGSLGWLLHNFGFQEEIKIHHFAIFSLDSLAG